MALTGFKVLASSGFEKEIVMVDFLSKNMLGEAHLQVLLKDGLFGKKLKFFKADIKEAEIVDENEVSSDSGQRVKNAAIGIVLLGPIGLLGAALGGAKKHISLRLTLLQGQQLVLEMTTKECSNVLKELAGLDINKILNEQLLKE